MDRTEFIGKLNMIYVGDNNAIDDITAEFDRLNNIINKLENYLNEQVNYMTHNSIERMVAFDCCRHKLQELKGSYKEQK